MIAVFIVFFALVFLVFFTVRVRVDCYIDVLNGRFLVSAALPFRIKRILLKGRLDDGEFVVFLFNKEIKPKEKRVRKRDEISQTEIKKVVKRIDILGMIRRFGLENLSIDALNGGDDFTVFLFLNTFISNLLAGYLPVLEHVLNIDASSYHIATYHKAACKIRIRLSFLLNLFKVIRIIIRLKK
ncbi:MAG: hypothetical protein LBT20_03450 [Clostridiales bacterium]|jgi:hypothetical protein|nr:hypothetical protein [Clostridiales bacterium]